MAHDWADETQCFGFAPLSFVDRGVFLRQWKETEMKYYREWKHVCLHQTYRNALDEDTYSLWRVLGEGKG